MEFLSSLTLFNDQTPFLLEKRILLLQAIDEAGSISKAAKMVPMSYKAAWDACDSINNLCPHPVITRETGGKGGGGTKITPYGHNLLKTYNMLEQEHKKFLQNLSENTDFDRGTIKSLQRFSMQISARNRLQGVIETIASTSVNAQIHLRLKSGNSIMSVITKSAVEELALVVGDEVSAIFKSNSVLLTTDDDLKISARNQINGLVDVIIEGKINSEVVVSIGNGDKIASVITTSSVKNLGIKEQSSVSLIIKASDVMIGK